MPNAIFWMVAIILAILIGAISYGYAKKKGKLNPDTWAVGAFIATLLAAIAFDFYNKKKK